MFVKLFVDTVVIVMLDFKNKRSYTGIRLCAFLESAVTEYCKHFFKSVRVCNYICSLPATMQFAVKVWPENVSTKAFLPAPGWRGLKFYEKLSIANV